MSSSRNAELAGELVRLVEAIVAGPGDAVYAAAETWVKKVRGSRTSSGTELDADVDVHVHQAGRRRARVNYDEEVRALLGT